MHLAINQATLMKSSMELFLNSVARAGFKGVELRRDQTFSYLKDHAIRELKYLLDENGLNCISFNAIELFSLCSKRKFNKIMKYTERLMDIGNQIGCKLIIAVPSFADEQNLATDIIFAKTIERLKVLAKLSAKYDFKIGFEPLGFPNCSVRKIDKALKIISNENLPDMGLIIDTFHYFIGEHSISDLDLIPLEKIWLIHLNDAIEKSFKELQDGDRVLPYQGFFDLEKFLKKLKEIGYEKWISLELFNEKLWNEDPYEVAQEAMTSIRRLIS